MHAVNDCRPFDRNQIALVEHLRSVGKDNDALFVLAVRIRDDVHALMKLARMND